ncbi:hypothetical protein JXL19_06610 [bacterium]|nr:hypothetical protein [bacterium]
MTAIDFREKLFCIIICSLLIAGFSEASEKKIEILASEEEMLVTTPRKVITTAFQVFNNTDDKREFISEIRFPDGWRLITKDFPFELSPGEREIRLLSLFIPQYALAGKYEIVYSVKDKNLPSLCNSHTLFVMIMPVIKLNVTPLEAPDYIIAGEDCHISFSVTNQSNAQANIGIKINGSEDMQFIVDPKEFSLEPNESKKVKAIMKTDKNIQKIIKQTIRFTAEVIENKGIQAQANVYVDIIPEITQVEDRYHKISGKITFRYGGKKDDEDKSGFQGEVSGDGTLDEDGKRHIKFSFKGCDPDYESIYGKQDEYFLSHWTNDYELHLGDRVYSLSSLTENYLYGRGIEGKHAFGNLNLKAYHMETSYLYPEKRQTGGSINYTIRDNHKIALNLLNKKGDNMNNEDDEDNIVSLSGNLKPVNNTDLEIEYANSGNSDDSYLLGISGYKGLITYYIKSIHADPHYPGYYKDINILSANLTFSLTSRLRLTADFKEEKGNLDLDPQLGSAALNRFYQLGFNYYLNSATSLLFDRRWQIRKDRLPVPTFESYEDGLRFGITHAFKGFNIYTSVELIDTDDRFTNQFFKSENYTLSAYFKPNDRLHCGGYIFWKKDGNSTAEEKYSMTSGFNLSYKLLDSAYFSLNYQANNYQTSEEDHDNFEVKLDHTFNNKTAVSIFGRHTSYKNSYKEDETIFKLEYIIPFGLPVSRKKSIGGIKGRIYDVQTNETPSNILLRLNGATAVTDKDGDFVFPAVKPGTVYLNIDRTGIDPNKITAQKTPIVVTVDGGKDTFIEIPLTEKAVLYGRVTLYDFEKNGFWLDGDTNMVEGGGAENMIVEVSNGSEVNRRITDSRGRFEFEELRPGNWILKVWGENIPVYHSLEKDTFEIQLKPGENRELVIKALPRKRHINIIDEGGIITEE